MGVSSVSESVITRTIYQQEGEKRRLIFFRYWIYSASKSTLMPLNFCFVAFPLIWSRIVHKLKWQRTMCCTSYGNFAPATTFPCTKMTFIFQLKLSLLTKIKPLILGAKITIFPWNFRHRPLCNETLSFGSSFRIWNLRKIQLLLKKWEQKQNTP